MLTKLTAAVAALAIAAGTIAAAPVAFHKAADLATADNAMLALASPDAMAAPDFSAKLDQVGDRLQKLAAITPQPAPQVSQWTSVDQWGRK
ncbi:MAG: hypothetical protein EPN40_10400 [Rhodanobacteraceae bacterium]|nr:MAG: hypothetical protein EPN40_10400 [Rhodanobacteraceae bacterium]